eukprot:m.200094 g.200094  ORF g.200094 m.200094 type:complete len:213 (-) comp15494_c13_seq1:691-1329(-)
MAQFKSFISEKELEVAKQIQHNEKAAPTIAPGHKVAHKNREAKTLFEQIQMQRMMEQEQWEESHSFKNLIYRGLDEEEAEYLEQCLHRETDRNRREQEEVAAQLEEFKRTIVDLEKPSSEPLPAPKLELTRKAPPVAVKKNVQASILASAIKRKGVEGPADAEKKARPESKGQSDSGERSTTPTATSTTAASTSKDALASKGTAPAPAPAMF